MADRENILVTGGGSGIGRAVAIRMGKKMTVIVADLNEDGPNLNLPEPPGSKLQASTGTSVYQRGKRTTLKVVGAERLAELYLVQGTEQRTIGRALSPSNVLVTEDLIPGEYTLVHLSGGEEKSWEVSLGQGSVTFDVRTGQIVQ